MTFETLFCMILVVLVGIVSHVVVVVLVRVDGRQTVDVVVVSGFEPVSRTDCRDFTN